MPTPDNNPTDHSTDSASRRAVLRSAGIVGGVAAAAALAACGSSSGSTGSTTGGGTSSAAAGGSPAASAGGSGSKTVAASRVPVGSGMIDDQLQSVITQPTKGDFKAFSYICTHQGCPVTQISGERIICPCHGSEFSIKDGSVLQGPATQPLARMTATVEGSQVVIS